MGLRGILAGALVLIALQTLVQPAAAGRVSGIFSALADFANRALDPARPAIGDHSHPASSSSSSSSGGGIGLGALDPRGVLSGGIGLGAIAGNIPPGLFGGDNTGGGGGGGGGGGW